MRSCGNMFYTYLYHNLFFLLLYPTLRRYKNTYAKYTKSRDIKSREIKYTRFVIYNSLPADSLKETQLPKDPSLLKMQQDQMDLMRKKKDIVAIPQQTDLIYYKQREAQKDIQKDSTLKIKPEYGIDKDSIATT